METNIKFNELEKSVYKFVCEIGCNIIKSILQAQDQKLMHERDKKIYRHKGYRKNCIKTIMGEIEYTRAMYLVENGNKKSHIFLLDKEINIDCIGKISINLAEKMLNTVVNTVSYRKGAMEINNVTNETISHQALNDLVWKVGETIEKKENEEIKLYKQEKLVKGNRQTPALFEEADGIWFNLQGKDRKNAMEKYKKECERKNKPYNPHQKHKNELKLHITYEGWKKGSTRHELVNKTYIAGMMSVDKLKKLRNARVYQTYNEDTIELRASNGDGASWINSIATKDTIRQKDLFHIQQEIVRDVPKEYRNILEELLVNKEYEKIPQAIDGLMYQVHGEEKAVKKLQKLKNYLKDGLPRYTDILKEQGREMPQAPQGIEYRDMGTMESQIFSVLEVKLCSGRKSFLKQGANYLSKVCVEYFENNGEIELEKIENEIPVDNSVQEWIEEIERNVQANKKRHMANEKITEVYNCPRGTVIGVSEELKQLLKILEPTALMYR